MAVDPAVQGSRRAEEMESACCVRRRWARREEGRVVGFVPAGLRGLQGQS